jgi:hypothetical protein
VDIRKRLVRRRRRLQLGTRNIDANFTPDARS